MMTEVVKRKDTIECEKKTRIDDPTYTHIHEILIMTKEECNQKCSLLDHKR